MTCAHSSPSYDWIKCQLLLIFLIIPKQIIQAYRMWRYTRSHFSDWSAASMISYSCRPTVQPRVCTSTTTTLQAAAAAAGRSTAASTVCLTSHLLSNRCSAAGTLQAKVHRSTTQVARTRLIYSECAECNEYTVDVSNIWMFFFFTIHDHNVSTLHVTTADQLKAVASHCWIMNL